MTTDKQDLEQTPEPTPIKPDEHSGMYIRGFLKITDPDTGKVIVETGN